MKPHSPYQCIPKFYLNFFSQKCFNTLSFGMRKNFLWHLSFVGAHCAIMLLFFFNRSSAGVTDVKICHSNTPPRTKTGFVYVHNHLFPRTNIPFTISHASVYLQFQNMRYRSISQTHIFKSYLPGLLLCIQ